MYQQAAPGKLFSGSDRSEIVRLAAACFFVLRPNAISLNI
jgi:hypothetical protein